MEDGEPGHLRSDFDSIPFHTELRMLFFIRYYYTFEILLNLTSNCPMYGAVPNS